MREIYMFSVIFLTGFLVFKGEATLVDSDKKALLNFLSNVSHSRFINWNEQSPVCKNWTGVTCSEDGARVIAVRLPGVGFYGPIPVNTLSHLSALQILSLRSNAISGPFPFDLLSLKNLTNLYLQLNSFSGPLPSNFSVWKNLVIVDLSNNGFNGSIPSSVSNLHNLQLLNLSNNKLTGSLPKPLQRFPKSWFVGNDISLPYSPIHGFSSSIPPHPKPKSAGKLSEKVVIGIVVGACVLGLIGFISMLLVCFLKKKDADVFVSKLEKGHMTPERKISRNEDANNKLVFFEGCNYVFDLEDLLRASAVVLGKGTFGMAYKAILEDGRSVVVKRLKEVRVGKREFEQQMELVGSIKHDNVIELRAYYYSKDEKLVVCDYYCHGSVATMLHGTREEDRIPLSWKTRLRIAVGAARGIAQIHRENGGGDEVISLVRWVTSVVKEEWTGEVFDVELMKYPNIEEELVELLQIAMSCVVRFPEQRPKMLEVVEMIENIRPGATGNPGSFEAKSETSTPTPLLAATNGLK
ncbi:probable inactive receptor kinase At4g23740 isoform X2 [Daucus carota subsp. sativus]|uniref:probable inactive receptor kinase At4g23740 isoform X2 n=1 Tax=Daucus carota subsp. sativus TaxID=79200 RepID=UPI0030832DC8